MPRSHARIATAILVILLGDIALAGDQAGIDFFEKKIRPVLVEQCYKCHSSAKRQRGGLALDSKQSVLKGGDSGPAIIPGKVESSLLIKAVRYTDAKLQMPPDGKLPDHVIGDLERWVKMGAPDPRTAKVVNEGSSIDIEDGRKFWAFQLPKKHPVPDVKNHAWPATPIDRFILAKLEAKNVKPIQDSDRVTLIRRAYFALIGLPPSPEEIDAFINDRSANAFAKVVDKLLASPHFGERWGRHWLDVARYAESSGGGRSLLMPDAWRYRDYVVHAFNTDKPFSRFILEQIAGDLLEANTKEERYWNLVALAYLILGPINYEMQDKPVLESDVIDEQLDSIGRAFLGMTIGCARCHDHKFDPIPQTDYYAMAGILRNTQSLVHDNVSTWVERPLPMPQELAAKIKSHDDAVKALQQKIKLAKAELKRAGVSLAAMGALAAEQLPGIVIDDTEAKKIGSWSKSVFMSTFVDEGYVYANSGPKENTITFNPTITRDGYYDVRLAYLPHPNRSTKTYVRILHTDGETDLHINQRDVPPIDGRWLSLGKYRFEKGEQWFVLLSTKGTDGVVVADAVQFLHVDEVAQEKRPETNKATTASSNDLKAKLQRLENELKKLQGNAPKRPVAMGVKDVDHCGDFYINIRGNIHNKGPSVKRGFLQVATYGPVPAIRANQSGRLQLAQWISSDKNPLTARVIVNRIWHHLFGTGIVRTPDNFGSTGSAPSHPELLDYLAVRFMEEGWSIKKLIREIMLSHTYQLSSRIDEREANVQRALKEDVENRLLWRQNRRRLEAEAIRDAMLTVSGQLDRTMGEPMFSAKVNERDFTFTDSRRSIYTPVFRNNLLELFEVFDFPDPNLVKGARATSTVAPQALYLMNSPFVMEHARKAAERTLRLVDTRDDQQIRRAYRTTLGRLPTDGELELGAAFLRQAGEQNQLDAWERLYQVLFASIDFRYVE